MCSADGAGTVLTLNMELFPFVPVWFSRIVFNLIIKAVPE